MRWDCLFQRYFIARKGVLMLTDEQKKRITEMRLEGMGYQAIANALGDGVSKGNIRYFCKWMKITTYHFAVVFQ